MGATDLHDALIPPSNYLANTDGKLKGLATVNRAVELCAVLRVSRGQQAERSRGMKSAQKQMAVRQNFVTFSGTCTTCSISRSPQFHSCNQLHARIDTMINSHVGGKVTHLQRACVVHLELVALRAKNDNGGLIHG